MTVKCGFCDQDAVTCEKLTAELAYAYLPVCEYHRLCRLRSSVSEWTGPPLDQMHPVLMSIAPPVLKATRDWLRHFMDESQKPDRYVIPDNSIVEASLKNGIGPNDPCRMGVFITGTIGPKPSEVIRVPSSNDEFADPWAGQDRDAPPVRPVGGGDDAGGVRRGDVPRTGVCVSDVLPDAERVPPGQDVQPQVARIPDDGYTATTARCRGLACESPIVIYRTVTRSDGGHADEHYRCLACGAEWWIDGPDA